MSRHQALEIGSRTRRRDLDIASLPYASEVAPGIYLLTPAGRTFALENTLFVRDEINVLFDTGLSYEQILELRDSVDLVVNTHAHIGHTGKDYLFPEVWAFEGSAHIVEDFERTLEFHGLLGQPFEADWRELMASIGAGHGKAVARRFADGDVLDFGRTKWRVILAPGHSPDHCCFYEPNLELLYAADVTLAGFGPWYGTPLSDITAFEHSIQRLMALPIRAVATSGKGPIFDDITGALSAFHGHFEARDRRILALLERERSIPELVDALPIYGSFGARQRWRQMIRHYEQTMVEKHIQRLVAQGRIRSVGEKYRAI